ncbi:MAG: hypothetical protein LLG13_14715 [Bacteroidales bacterium]|nr:hypothetical protein [Bacteroidales bacterium]
MTTITRSPLEEGYDFYITDKWNKEYHFKILTFEIPPGMLSVAIETAEETETYYPRKLEVLSDYNADIELAELLLKAKIKKEINRKSLRLSSDNSFEIIGNTLRGEIIAEQNISNLNEPVFAVDGRKISIQQFCEMLAPYFSFRFKFEITDSSDEIF